MPVAIAAAAGAGAAAAAGCGLAGVAEPLATAFSISDFTTRPWGPDPATLDRSRPASFARRRASGEEKTRLPVSADSGGGFRPLAPCRGLFLLGRRSRFAGLLLRLRSVGFRLGRRLRRVAAALGSLCRIFAFCGEDGDHGIDLDVFGAGRNDDLGENAFVDGFHFHGRLVGLDFGDDVTGRNGVAFLLQPLGNRALFHRRREGGHQ